MTSLPSNVTLSGKKLQAWTNSDQLGRLRRFSRDIWSVENLTWMETCCTSGMRHWKHFQLLLLLYAWFLLDLRICFHHNVLNNSFVTSGLPSHNLEIPNQHKYFESLSVVLKTPYDPSRLSSWRVSNISTSTRHRRQRYGITSRLISVKR